MSTGFELPRENNARDFATNVAVKQIQVVADGTLFFSAVLPYPRIPIRGFQTRRISALAASRPPKRISSWDPGLRTVSLR